MVDDEHFSRTQKWLLICGIVALTLVVYGRSLGNEFVTWDDGSLIIENPLVHSLSFSSLIGAFTSYDPELYVPLTTLSYQFNYFVAGLHPFTYHFTNLALHILNVLGVVWVVFLLYKKKSVAIAVGLLFAVHPLNTEAVAWASARKDVLVTVFFLLTLGWYITFLRTSEQRYRLWSVIAFLLALLSKVTVILTPFLLLLIDWYEGKPVNRTALKEKWPYLFLAVLFGVVAWFGKATSGSFLFEKVLIGMKSIIFYLLKLLWPVHLSAIYPYTSPIALSTSDLFFSTAAVIALCVVVYIFRRHRIIVFAWLFYLSMLLPTLTNITRGRNELLDVIFASDRYAYIPVIGILIFAGLLFQALRNRWRRIADGGLALLICMLAIAAYAQSLTWKDSRSLFTQVLACYANSYVAHTNIGTELFKSGDIDGAMAEYERAVAIRPDGTTYYNIGQIHLSYGRTNDAIAAFRSAIAVSHKDPDPFTYLGVLLLEQGNASEGKAMLEKAYALKGAMPQTAYYLGVIAAQEGRKEEAAAFFRESITLGMDSAEVEPNLRALGVGE
ncbi:MAG: tetratricopeptide repeat protein [Candidatus Peribacteraceae bacterium]|nr:tetratricopeptide repeat protein [Candidatus Peribacteraceae bacterium]